jgi:hypothetical protein
VAGVGSLSRTGDPHWDLLHTVLNGLSTPAARILWVRRNLPQTARVLSVEEMVAPRGIERPCLHCGTKTVQQFCTPGCRKGYRDARSATTTAAVLHWTHCERCGARFETTAVAALYCGECRRRAFRAFDHVVASAVPIACEQCGQIFLPTRATQRFCSKICNARHVQARRRRERAEAAAKGQRAGAVALTA